MPPEKQKIIKPTLFSVIFYISLNTWFDTKLKNSIIHSNNNKINSSLKSIITDKIIQSQSDRIEQFIQGKDKVDIKPSIAQIESITNLILYGNEKYKIWLDTSSIILPFLSSPTQTNDQIVEKIIENNEKFNPGSQYNKKRLSEAKGDERKELIVNIIDFKQQVKNSLTSSLEPLTDTLKASWFYKSRRYLNGFIQFVTIWLASIPVRPPGNFPF
jgi:hypothetical protein